MTASRKAPPKRKAGAPADKPEASKVEPAASLPITGAKPVAHGEAIDRLEFRAPTPRDMVDIGNPVIFDMAHDPPRVVHDMSKMVRMISRLAAVPESTIMSLDTVDLTSACWLITPFFMPIPGTV